MAKRQAKTTPVEDETNIQVIIPEVVETVTPEQEEGIKANALQIVSFTDQQLIEIETKYGSFAIAGDPDLAKEARTVKNKLVKVRTGIERKRKELNRTFTDACNAEAARITDRTSKVEQHLAKEVELFEQAEQRRIEERRRIVVDRLLTSGFDFNGVAYVCGEQMIWQLEVDTIDDEALDNACSAAQVFRQNEATAAAEAARRAAPVYLHQPDLNELMQLTRGEYEVEADALAGNGVIEITKEQYDEIKAAKLAAFRRPAPAATPTPAPTPAPAPTPEPTPTAAPVDERDEFPEHDPRFMEKPGAPKPNEDFLAHREAPDAPVPSAAKTLDAYEQAFDQGYEAFRSQMLAAFRNDAMKLTRAQWIEHIINLQPIPKV